MIRGFFLGFVRVHLLHHAAVEPIYGLAMIEELRRHGYDLSPGTLYPILHEMEAAGLLTRTAGEGDGRRKYYRATRDGESVLEEARRQIRELVDEVLEEDGR